ncbi:transcriptional regulator MraZ [Clostridia bacterium]|nr:transcriptional regulator MraZ [Clostridia bacterium]
MLYGTHRHTIDAKGRLFVPAKFRAELGERFFVSIGSGCLIAFLDDEWWRLEAKLSTNNDLAAFASEFFSMTEQCEPDAQGRVLIPQNLREYAGLKKDVVFAGKSRRAQIWDAERWDARKPKDFASVLEGLGL